MNEARSTHGSLLRSTGVISAATLISRVLGLVRDSVIFAFWGKEYADIFIAAFRVPNFFRRLFAEGTLSSAFVPVFTTALQEDGEDEARNLAAALFRTLTTFLGVVCLLAMLFAPQLMALLAGGFEGVDIPGEADSKLELSGQMARIMMPFLLFVGLAAIAMGMLNSLGRFFVPAVSPAFFNVGIIVCSAIAVGMVEQGALPDIRWVAVGVAVGGLCQLFVQMPPLWKLGYLRKPFGTMSHPKVWLTLQLAVPAIAGLAVYQLNILVTTYFASLESGYNTWLYAANRIVQFPLGVLGIAIATAALPRLSGEALLEEKETFIQTLRYAMRKTLYIMLPAAVGIALIAEDAVALAFNRGEFRADGSLIPTTHAVWIYAIGVPAFSLLKVVASSYYAFKDMKTPLYVASVSVAFNIVLCWVLFEPMGYAGLALAPSLSAILNVGLLILLQGRRLGGGWSATVWGASARIALASALMALPCLAVLHFWPIAGQESGPRLARLFLVAGLGAVVYGGISLLMMRDEMQEVMDTIQRRRNRRRGQ